MPPNSASFSAREVGLQIRPEFASLPTTPRLLSWYPNGRFRPLDAINGSPGIRSSFCITPGVTAQGYEAAGKLGRPMAEHPDKHLLAHLVPRTGGAGRRGTQGRGR